MKKILFSLIVVMLLLVSCDSPPSVETLAANFISDSELITLRAEGQLTSDGGSALLGYGICLSKDNPYPTVNDTKKELGSSSALALKGFSTSFTLNEPGTYYIRAYAYNEVGLDYGEALSISTNLETRVETREAINITPNSAVLTSKINPNGSETKVYFQIGQAKDQLTQEVYIGSVNGYIDTTVVYNYLNLKAAEFYFYRIKTTNDRGAMHGEVKSFSTPVSDTDGNDYPIVQIGDQIWMQVNLKTTRYANGDTIPNITDQTEWANLKTPGYCYYNNDPAMGHTHGALYNFYVGADDKELIAGWHVPTYEDWIELISNSGGDALAAGKLKATGYEHWLSPNAGATNESGFTALAGGGRTDNDFQGLGYSAVFWSSTYFGMNDVGWNFAAHRSSAAMNYGGTFYFYGMSLRLIKNR